MSESAIRKLQRKFVSISMGALVITMFLIAGLLYAGSTMINRRSVRETLDYIIANEGELVSYDVDSEEIKDVDSLSELYELFFEQLFSTGGVYQSQEFQFSTRYFAVIFDSDGEVSEVKTSHIRAVSDAEATEYAMQVLEKRSGFGRYDSYYYERGTLDSGNSIVVFIESTSILQSNQRLLNLALILIGFGMIVAFFIVRVLSKRVIAHELENAELQKQFMTNVSHELKTPLAVIRANTEMIEMLDGENEWTQSTMRQVSRMDGLIKNLVMISKSNERHAEDVAERMDVSAAVKETVDNFNGLAKGGEKTLICQIDPDIMMFAEDAQVRQLTSLLVDNAIKYCDEHGEIRVELKQKGKTVVLIVSNSYAEGKNVDYTRFFERFYREDASHNVDKGGYGIGLSVAESIVKAYHGTIDVAWENGVISFSCVLKMRV